MKPILLGAVLALLWLVLGLPHTTPVTVPGPLLQPVVVAFALGVVARPYLVGGRWLR
ncbi:hypothetical protein QF032_003772 [Streptomyces achromogenes]|uniref:hypothetical protein n=1 Tax=Streptomyces achromogenes TaxID=67255 RepID=UPI00277FDAB0|nr:hypothetical protein [Streptomyces achromogenes]MDQ0831928.1 hypothetical protein [Streptomyces achromogenes]